jgi:hypothetical protein
MYTEKVKSEGSSASSLNPLDKFWGEREIERIGNIV